MSLLNDVLKSFLTNNNIPAEQSGNLLSELLPALIDRLTPDGQVPDQNQMATLGKSVLASLVTSGIFGGKSNA